MNRHWLIRGLKFALLAAAFVAGFGALAMALWNSLMPGLFGWHTIGFWQAVGLLVLSRIMLGGLRAGPGHSPRWRARMFERWEQMSDEEREKFRAGMRGRCGHSKPTSEPSGA